MSESRFDDSQDYFAAIAESYDRLQPVVAGPGYEAGLEFALKLVPYSDDDAFTMVELGCGTASLTSAVLSRFAQSRAVAIDGEPAMLRVARQKLAAYGARAEVVEADVATCDLPSFDLVLSSFILHHISPQAVGEVLERTARALTPGGCLIVVDTMQVGPRWADRVGALSRRLYEGHVADAVSAGVAEQEEIDARWEFKWKMKAAGKDIEHRHRAEEILALMHELGFDEAGLVWRMFASTILMGFTRETVR
jgi:ubiquinone/menaquinone biosynthesis C-methylase UbiE